MKNLESFDAYRLEKDQMARISGGLICDVYYDDELGGSVPIPFQSMIKKHLKKHFGNNIQMQRLSIAGKEMPLNSDF